MKFKLTFLWFIVIFHSILMNHSRGCTTNKFSLKDAIFRNSLLKERNTSFVLSKNFSNFLQRNENIVNNDEKYCRFRDFGLYPDQLWVWLTSGMCYYYTDPNRLIDALPLLTIRYTINNISYSFYVTRVNETILPFDYTNPETNDLVASTFSSERFYEKWYDCSKSADECCTEEMNNENIYPSDEYPCSMVWDGWSCYPQTQAGATATKACPLYSVSVDSFPCTVYSQKYCFPNGTWNQTTDYTGCATASIYRRRHYFHIIALSVSVILSFPAIIIFFCFERLRILRVILHRNLLIACVLRNIFTIVNKRIVILDALDSTSSQGVMATNGIVCKVLAFFENASVNSIYSWMLMEGFYLHKLIVRIFSDDPNIYILYGITFALIFIPSIIWAIVRSAVYDNNCWMSDTKGYSWIGDSVRISILVANVLLLIDIIRVLVLKIRRNHNSEQTRSTMKAMFFLVPLFGVPFFLTIDTRMAGDSCLSGDIFFYFSYILQALQGVSVAAIFCYFNKEVQNHIKGSYRKLKINFEERFGLGNRRKTQNINRRVTESTTVRQSQYIHPSVSENMFPQNETLQPKHTVAAELMKHQENIPKRNTLNVVQPNDKDTSTC